MKKPKDKPGNPGASRKDVSSSSYSMAKAQTQRHARGDDPYTPVASSVTPSLAQQRYKA